MQKILIVDDEKNVLSSFKRILEQDGYEVLTACNAEDGLSLIKGNSMDLLIMDIRMSGMSGLEAFSHFKKIDTKMPVIIMTAQGTTETAIEAMQLGAYDYVLKPFEIPDMREIISKALEAGRVMKTQVSYEVKPEFEGDRIIGISAPMQQIYKTIGQVAATDVAVLLRGESGTGKELIARALYSYSQRKNKPIVIINSAAIPEPLLESELFGYEKGAFTDAHERKVGKLEQADGGTVFLDEIGDMPLSVQTKVLRVLDNKSFERLGSNKSIKVDIRFISATNKNLEDLIKTGKFREDLYYRLNAVTINVPPLRERKEDIPKLVEYFLNRCNKEYKKSVNSASIETLNLLKEYDWFGNVRELENVIKRAVLLTKSNILSHGEILMFDKVDLQDKDRVQCLRDALGKIIQARLSNQTTTLYKDIIEEIERILILEILRQTLGNQSQAAKVLGISRPTLKEKIVKFKVYKDINLQED